MTNEFPIAPKSTRLINIDKRRHSLTCHRRHPWNKTARDPYWLSSTDRHPAAVAVHVYWSCPRVTARGSSARVESILRSGWAGPGRRWAQRPRRRCQSFWLTPLQLLSSATRRRSPLPASSTRLVAAVAAPRPADRPRGFVVTAIPRRESRRCKIARCRLTGTRNRRQLLPIRCHPAASCHPLSAPPSKQRSCSESTTFFRDEGNTTVTQDFRLDDVSDFSETNRISLRRFFGSTYEVPFFFPTSVVSLLFRSVSLACLCTNRSSPSRGISRMSGHGTIQICLTRCSAYHERDSPSRTERRRRPGRVRRCERRRTSSSRVSKQTDDR